MYSYLKITKICNFGFKLIILFEIALISNFPKKSQFYSTSTCFFKFYNNLGEDKLARSVPNVIPLFKHFTYWL